MRLLAIVVAVSSCAFARAQVDEDLAKAIVAEGIEHSRVMEWQDQLCHRIGHRLTGSDNCTRACAWARDAFAAMGLVARLEAWGEWKVEWNRGQWQGRVLAPEPLELQVATPAWSAGTRGQVTARLLTMPADAEGLKAIEAIAASDERCWLWGPLPKDAELKKAVEALLASGKMLGRVQSAKSTGVTDKRYANQIRVFGDHHRAMLPLEQEPQAVEAVVRDDQADAIERMLAGTAPVQLQLELRNQFRPGPVRLDNVTAELRGSQWPDEVVIVCAHLDSWHQATGATDNGTGTCSTLEAARILAAAGAKPKRTIRFILWTGEEEGLLGSRQYVVQHRREMPRVSAVFNHDSGTNWAQGLTVPASEADDFTAASAPVLQLLHSPEQGFDGAVFALTPRPVLQPAGGGSDHASFGAVGVPAFGWHLHGESQYGYGWHSQWDTYDIVIGRYQRHTATVIALVALGIANLDHPLSRQGVERAKPSGGLTAQLVVEAWLGIELDGLKVTAVGPGGSGAQAGLLPGDTFAAVAGTDVADATAMLTALRTAWQEAPAAKVSVQRSGERVEVTLMRQ